MKRYNLYILIAVLVVAGTPALRTPLLPLLSFARLNAALDAAADAIVGRVRPATVGQAVEFSLSSDCSLDAAAADRVLASYGSPAVGSGAATVAFCQAYGIDNAYVLAMFIQESSAGTALGWAGQKGYGRSTANPGNIICAGYASCFNGFRDYADDWSAGWQAMFQLLASYRDERGLVTIRDAIAVWAPSSDGNDPDGYASTVEARVREWRGRPTTFGGRHTVTDRNEVNPNAHFWTVDCSAWSFQTGCQHYGSDYLGDDGDAVYAPRDLIYQMTGSYPEGGPTAGEYVIGLLPDGCEFYAGHLRNARQGQPGELLVAGTILGYIRADLAHTHIQLRCGGVLMDWEQYEKEHS